MIFNFNRDKKSFELSDEEQGEIIKCARGLGVTTGYIVQKLANIYGANLTEDLEWISEMLAEDQAEQEKLTKSTRKN